MLKHLQWFLERLVERLLPLVGIQLTSALAAAQALLLAEQQNQLEEAARRYEAEDKPEIAAALRRRAAELVSADPAPESLQFLQQLLARPLLSGGAEISPGNDRGKRSPTPATADEDPPSNKPAQAAANASPAEALFGELPDPGQPRRRRKQR